jgi:hypothetical protein
MKTCSVCRSSYLRWSFLPLSIILGLSVSLAQSTSSETPPVTPPAVEAVVPDKAVPTKLRFVFLNETPGAYTIAVGAEKPIPLVANAFAISAPVIIPAGEKIKVFRQTPKANPVQVAELSTRPELTTALIVMSAKPDHAPAKKGDKTPESLYKDTWIDDTATGFTAGQIRIINLAPTPARVTFVANAHTIEPEGTLIVTPVWDDRGRARTLVETKQAAKWTTIYDNITSHRVGERVTAVIVHSDKGLSFSYTAHEVATFGTPPAGDFWLIYTDSE